MSAAGATTANISFIIPNIAYTPEDYTIRYTGETFQTNETTSMLRMSSDNISMVNESYMFMLRGLEEANTYTYTVDSTNCHGTTSTAVMSFTTISTRKGGMELQYNDNYDNNNYIYCSPIFSLHLLSSLLSFPLHFSLINCSTCRSSN